MLTMQRVSRPYLMGHGLLMLGLGMALFFISSAMTNPVHDESGYTAATVVMSFILLIAVTDRVILLKNQGKRRMARVQILVGSLTIAGWSAFWLIQAAPVELRFLLVLAGMQGVFWGLWYLDLAFRLSAHKRKAIPLSILAATTPALGIVLATQPEVTRLSAVTAVSCFTIVIGVQTLFTVVFLNRHFEEEKTHALSLLAIRVQSHGEDRRIAHIEDTKGHNTPGMVDYSAGLET